MLTCTYIAVILLQVTEAVFNISVLQQLTVGNNSLLDQMFKSQDTQGATRLINSITSVLNEQTNDALDKEQKTTVSSTWVGRV